LNGNAFTNTESRLEAVDSSGASSGQPNGGIEATYPPNAIGSLRLEASSIRAAKLDEDDLDDLIVRYRFDGCPECEATMVMISAADDPTDNAARASTWMVGIPLEAADLDGDGRSELVGIDTGAGEILVYDPTTGKERERFDSLPCLKAASGPERIPFGEALEQIAAYRLVDVNGDARADLLCVGQRVTTRDTSAIDPLLTIHLARTDRLGFAAAIEHRWPGHLRAFGDFDGDSKLDYLLQEPEVSASDAGPEGSLKLAVAYGDGAGSFTSPMRVHEDTKLTYGSPLAVADFNGDGVSDFVWLDDFSSCAYELREECGEVRNGGYFVHQADPAVFFGSKTRGETFAYKSFTTNLVLDNTTLNFAADLNGDGAAELVQISQDLQLSGLGSFLRIMSLIDSVPTLVSSTQLEYGNNQDWPPLMGALDFRLAAGHFVTGDTMQLMVSAGGVTEGNASGKTTIYRWVDAE
jgi:hypothetical protein